jgi:hypothetical protein
MAIDIILKDGSTTQDRRLDRLVSFDERSRNYSAVATIDNPQPRSYTWNFNKYPGWLDQFREGACVGFGWAHELLARPAEIPVTNETARGIYKRAQQLDIWPGEAYEGTSVLAGAKATRELVNQDGRAYMQDFRWCFGGDDVVLTLGRRGPVVIGVAWLEGMFDTDAAGFIRPTGRVLGGHCTLLRGVRVVWRDNVTHYEPKDLVRELTVIKGRNSWGRSWGVDGDFLLALADLDTLLAMDGEACTPTIRST